MKIKYMIIYVLAGTAFLAVSLWAFLSNGRSARALRYKYKMGGILLTASAMLSAASCTGLPPFVSCYEPVVDCYDVAMISNDVKVEVKDYGGTRLKSGDVLKIRVDYPTFLRFRCRITAEPSEGEAFVIQTKDFDVVNDMADFEMPLAATGYKGSAIITVLGLGFSESGSEKETPVGTVSLTIL